MSEADPEDVPPHVVVTGAGGWLGQNLVRALVGHRARIRCLVTSREQAAPLELLDERVETTLGDVRDPAVADTLFDGMDGASVFHAAGVIHPTHGTRELFDVNVGGTAMVLDRARRAGTRRFVHVSSNSPFGLNRAEHDRFDENSPPNPYMAYGASKLEAEEIVGQSAKRGDVPAVIIRAPWFYGPFQPARQTQWFRAVRRGRFPMVRPGTQRRSMAYTGNLVHGLLCAETAPNAAGNAYWIADPEPYEFATIIATVRDALEAEGLPPGRACPRVPHAVSDVARRADALLQGRGAYSAAVHVLGELGGTIACDVSRARAEIGYRPATTLLDGMRASIRWCLEQGEQL